MKKGRKVSFHGAFKEKAKAVRRERSLSGAFIRKIKVRGHTRYVVMTRKAK